MYDELNLCLYIVPADVYFFVFKGVVDVFNARCDWTVKPPLLNLLNHQKFK